MAPSTTKSTAKIDLALDTGDNEDHPRRLVCFPQVATNNSSRHRDMLAYGGEDGTVSFLSTKDTKAKVIRRYDDGGVRAVAISENGKRVAVGFDDGSTKIYRYDDYDGSTSPHPFAASASSKKKNGNDDDNDDALFSQDFELDVDDDDDDKCFAGPQFDAPIRDLQFHPSSKNNDDDKSPYYLAIATEASLCVVDASSSSTLTTRFLQTEAQEHHDHCGIRGIAFSPKGDWLASLAMDGRLCVWSTPKTDDPKTTWKLLHREATTCIPRKDVGEIHGADPSDRSSRPLWVVTPKSGAEDSSSSEKDVYLATPGKVNVELRRMVAPANEKDSMQVVSVISDDAEDDEIDVEGGHVEAIVAIAQVGSMASIVTSGRDGRVIHWTIEDGKAGQPKELSRFKSTPTQLLFARKGVIHAACADGTGHTLQLPKSSNSSTNQEEEQSAPPRSENTTATDRSESSNTATKLATDKGLSSDPPTRRVKKLKKPVGWTTDDDDDEDVDFGDSGEADNDKDESTKKNNSRFIDDQADEEDDDAAAVEGDNQKEKEVSVELSQPSSPTAGDTLPLDTHHGDDDISEDLDMDRLRSIGRDGPGFAAMLPPAVEAQAAFCPSSTPLDLARRFLCWNHVGAITLLRGDDEVNNRNTVDITFTDSGMRRPISFTDNQNFIVGSLGEDGGIFASDLQRDDDDDDEYDDDDDVGITGLSERTKAAVRKQKRGGGKKDQGQPTGSSIYFHRFQTFSSAREKDWYLTLPDGERVLGSACGEGWAAVMTSRRFLRLFSSGGNQGQVIWLRGDPVTMAGRGRFLAVIYHESTPSLDGTQQMGYTLYDVASPSSIRVVSKGPLACISLGASLFWVGFSNDCSLMAMDTDGMLSMLVVAADTTVDTMSTPCPWEWSPILDTVGMRKSSDDQFWPVTVYDGKLVCVPLRGGTSYPDAARRPVTTTLHLRLPLAKSLIPVSAVLEELSVRSNMALAQKKVVHDIVGGTDPEEDFEQKYTTLCAQVDKVTLKLFAATIDANKLERALDLVDRLNLEKSFDLAMTLADRHRRLVEFIEDAKERKFSAVEDDDHLDDGQGGYSDEDEEFGQVSPPVTTATSRRQISPDAFSALGSKRSFGKQQLGGGSSSQWEPKKRKVF